MTGGDSRMVWDPNKGTFVSQTPPAQTTSTTGTQNQYDPSKFDPSQYQYNPFVGNFIDPTTGMRKGPDVGSPMPDFDQLEYDPRGYEDYLPDNPFSDRRQNNLPANQSRNFVMPPEFDPTTGMRKGPDVGRPMPDFSQFDYAGATSGFDTGNTPIGSTEVAPQAQSDLSQYSFNPYVEGMGFGQASQTPQTPFGMNYGDYSFGMPQYAGGGAIQKAAAGKLVTGDGDGMSDDIRANINGDQEARLADGEFVIPADVVSHIGNGSTDAGAEKLYTMMDRIRKARTGRTKQAPEIDADKYLPA
jgi:hypothetical protein